MRAKWRKKRVRRLKRKRRKVRARSWVFPTSPCNQSRVVVNSVTANKRSAPPSQFSHDEAFRWIIKHDTMSFIRNIIPFSIGIVQELALWFYFFYYRQSKNRLSGVVESFSNSFQSPSSIPKDLRFILGRFGGGGALVSKKYNNQMRWTKPGKLVHFSRRRISFFPYEIKAVCLDGAGKGSRKGNRVWTTSGLSCDTICLGFPVSSGIMMRSWSILTCDFAIVTARRVCFFMLMTSFCDVNDLMEMSNDLSTTIKKWTLFLNISQFW